MLIYYYIQIIKKRILLQYNVDYYKNLHYSFPKVYHTSNMLIFVIINGAVRNFANLGESLCPKALYWCRFFLLLSKWVLKFFSNRCVVNNCVVILFSHSLQFTLYVKIKRDKYNKLKYSYILSPAIYTSLVISLSCIC